LFEGRAENVRKIKKAEAYERDGTETAVQQGKSWNGKEKNTWAAGRIEREGGSASDVGRFRRSVFQDCMKQRTTDFGIARNKDSGFRIALSKARSSGDAQGLYVSKVTARGQTKRAERAEAGRQQECGKGQGRRKSLRASEDKEIPERVHEIEQ
jgi:hypothetical protein